MTVVLTGDGLTLDEVVRVARGGEPVALAPGTRERMHATRAIVEEAVARGDAVYGTTTGVGMRKRFSVTPAEAAAFNRRLLLDHRVGQGEPVGEDVVRGTMLRLANGFASGAAGVRPRLAERLVRALNDRELPPVRSLGSTGVSDLAPLADLAVELFGDADLEPKEGIALLNAGAFSTALAALALADAARFAEALDASAALDLEAFAANLAILHPRIADVRRQPGLVATLARLRALLEGSALWEPGSSRNLQDPLVFRCLLQVHGALRDALRFTGEQVGVELNASQDNPLVVPDEHRLVSVGNFDLVALAQALDLLRIALAPALASACERTVKLLQMPLTGLPEGLSARPGAVSGGLSEFAFPLQALTAEARLLAQPVSFETLSSAGAEGIEDRLTMAPLAARRLADMVGLGERALAIVLVLGAQAVDLRGNRLGRGTAAVREQVRGLVPFTGEDDVVPPDLEPLVRLVRSGAIA